MFEFSWNANSFYGEYRSTGEKEEKGEKKSITSSPVPMSKNKRVSPTRGANAKNRHVCDAERPPLINITIKKRVRVPKRPVFRGLNTLGR